MCQRSACKAFEQTDDRHSILKLAELGEDKVEREGHEERCEFQDGRESPWMG